ncbi:MAG: DsbA family protein [Myxococcaceae bacterium]
MNAILLCAIAVSLSQGLGLPGGLDVTHLSQSARGELAIFLRDEFCYCGCPQSVEECLAKHPSCRHARRMTGLAASLAEQGTASGEMSLTLGTYYQSFGAPRKALLPDARLCKGPPKAVITIVEFFDFECPACNHVRPWLNDLVQKNKDVRLCAVPFPLPGHPHAQPAGRLALLARDRGKFWDIYESIFEHQRELSVPLLTQLAAKVGVKAEEVRAALANGRYQDELRKMVALGRESGVHSTPSLFLNGRPFLLPLRAEALQHALDDEREWQRSGKKWAKD